MALKLDPPTFDAWMEILRRLPESVLWLYDGDDASLPVNLRREAEDRGVEARRLYFAGKAAYPDHLARYPLADLFLDSFTYNGGATAVDALRQGLPMITRIGETPLARMGASVARAAGFPDLVAETSESFVDLAVRLGNDRKALGELRARAGRQASRLFDLTGWLRGYQDAVLRAWDNRLAERLTDVEIPA